MTDEQNHALNEFRHAVTQYFDAVEDEDPTKVKGCRYALEMAAVHLQLNGLDPSRVTPDGYAGE